MHQVTAEEVIDKLKKMLLSAYVVWASGELSVFTTHFIKQVFMPQTTLSTIAECVILVRTQCERVNKTEEKIFFIVENTVFVFQLYTYGIDLCYQLDGSLRSPLSKALRDAKIKLIDSVKLRVLEDKWIPMNLHSKSALARFLTEHANMGLKLDQYVTGKGKLISYTGQHLICANAPNADWS